MKPTTNRAARRKPCTKQASIPFNKKFNNKINGNVEEKVKLENNYSCLHSSLSSAQKSLSSISPSSVNTSPTPSKGVTNPYKKIIPPPTTLSCRTETMLHNDQRFPSQQLLSDMSSSSSDDSDSVHSEFSGEFVAQAFPTSYNLRSATTQSPGSQGTRDATHKVVSLLPFIPPIDFSPSSPESSLATQDVATFDVSKIQERVRDLRQTFTSNSEAESIISNIEAECDNFKRLQQHFKSTQSSVESMMSEVKSSLHNLHRAPILHSPTCKHDNEPSNPHEESSPRVSNANPKVFEVPKQNIHDASNSQHTVDFILEPVANEQESSDASSIDDDSLAPQPQEYQKDDTQATLGESQHRVPISSQVAVAEEEVARKQPLLAPLVQFATPQFKNEHDVRFIAQNCRGAFQKGRDKHEHYEAAMGSFISMQADVVLLSETNTDWKVHDNHWNTLLMNKALWAPSPTKTTTSSCQWENIHRTSFQVGGTLSVFTGTITPRIQSSVGDRYGRWTETSVHLKKHKRLIIYNTYRTHSKKLSTAGIASPWMHQWKAIRNDSGKDVDPRKQHMTDLRHSIEKAASQGHEVIVIGDFNEDLGDKEEGGLELLEQCPHVVNLFLHLHGDIPSSRQNGRQIFHAYVSPNVLPFITRSGIGSFADGFSDSDHIPFFFDLDSSFFSTVTSAIVPPDARILQMYDTATVERYVKRVLCQCDFHSISSRLRSLSKLVDESGFTKEAEKELERIDSKVTAIRLQEEKNLMKKPTRYKGTSVTKTQVQKIRLLRALRKHHEKGKDCSHILERLHAYEYLVEINPSNLSSILTEEKQLLKQMQEDNDVHREEHLDAIYARLAVEKSVDKAIIVKEMKHREKQRRSWKKIAYVTKPHRRGVTRLGIPKGFEHASTKAIWEYLSDHTVQPEWTFITDSATIQRRLIEWQEFHYAQASETPLAASEWYHKLNPNSINDDEIDSVLRGSSTGLPMHNHPSTKVFFATLSENILPAMPKKMLDITEQKYISFYSKVKERTSSSPSGLHMGLWKAAATSSKLSGILAEILQISLSHSYVLQRWKKVVGVLLEKKNGSPLIHKFRTIHLVESDLNFAMRSIWGRNMMCWAEKQGGFNDSQFGGRKGYQAQTAALNKGLTCDVIRYYAEPASLIDNDAQACYDRIIPVVAAYTLMRLGMPKHLVQFQIRWLEQTRYALKLSEGLSSTYATKLDNYLFGTGQGTGWSPPTWGSLSDVISKIMDEHSPGMKLVHPNRMSIERVIDAFVDDVNSGLTFDSFQDFLVRHPTLVPTGKDVYDQTQKMVQFYSHILFATGGKLALHKCAVYILLTRWVQGRRKFKKTHLTLPPLQIYQGLDKDKPANIRIENPTTARRMLGVYTAPDGNSKLQTEILRAKSVDWGERVRRQYLNSYDTLMSFKQGIMKSLEYPVGASMVNEKNCSFIQSPALNVCLQKNGIVSTISRIIVYSPHRYGGLGIRSLYTESGIQKIELLLGHLRRRDKTSQILEVALGCIQQEIGLSTFILESDFTTYQCVVTDSWFKLLWEFLSKVNGQIHYPHAWIPSPTFQNDINLVQTFMRWDLSANQKYMLNICRLYKRCYFLGDILEPNGVRLRQGSLDLKDRGFHNDKFPDIPKPPKAFQELWQTAIRRMMKEADIGSHLGPIINTASFEWRLDASKIFLIRSSTGKQISVHYRVGLHRYSAAPSTLTIPIDQCFVCTVQYLSADTIDLKSVRTIESEAKISSHVTKLYFPPMLEREFENAGTVFNKFMEYLEFLPKVHQRNLGQLELFKEDFLLLRKDLSRNRMIGVCDASVQLRQAGHSYILENMEESVYVSGVAPVDSDCDDTTSNRAEGCSVLALIVLSSALASFFQIDGVTLPIYCDNAEALRHRHLQGTTYSKMVKRDIDLKMEIEYVRAVSSVNIVFRKVKGHLDDESDFVYEEADQEVRRNIDMDERSKAFLRNPPDTLKPTTRPGFFPSQRAGLYLAGTLMVGNIREQVHLHHYGYAMETRIAKMLGISIQSLEKIEWEGFQVAFASLPSDIKISRMKIIHDYLPVKLRLHERDRAVSSRCPRCQMVSESQTHLFLCKHKLNRKNHDDSMKQLRSALRKCNTHLLIVNAIDVFLTRVHFGQKIECSKHTLGDRTKVKVVDQVFCQQTLLGAFSLHKGFLARNWMVAQNVCLDKPDTESKDLPWMKKVIKALWSYSHDMWVQRCQNVHRKSKTDPCSLNHNELLFSIRRLLRTPRIQLSVEEKKLHLNVTRGLKVAHTRTLVDWLMLLSSEREKTIRNKREARRSKFKLQPITKFCRPVRTKE